MKMMKSKVGSSVVYLWANALWIHAQLEYAGIVFSLCWKISGVFRIVSFALHAPFVFFGITTPLQTVFVCITSTVFGLNANPNGKIIVVSWTIILYFTANCSEPKGTERVHVQRAACVGLRWSCGCRSSDCPKSRLRLMDIICTILYNCIQFYTISYNSVQFYTCIFELEIWNLLGSGHLNIETRTTVPWFTSIETRWGRQSRTSTLPTSVVQVKELSVSGGFLMVSQHLFNLFIVCYGFVGQLHYATCTGSVQPICWPLPGWRHLDSKRWKAR